MTRSSHEVTTILRDILGSQFFMALATQGNGTLHASLLAFAVSGDLRRIVFATPRTSRKFSNIRANGTIALLIDNRTNDPADLRAAVSITVHGLAREATGTERERLLELYIRRHPGLAGFAHGDGTALICVDVVEYDIVSNFQNVDVFVPGKQGLDQGTQD